MCVYYAFVLIANLAAEAGKTLMSYEEKTWFDTVYEELPNEFL